MSKDLVKAAEKGDMEGVKAALKRGAVVDYVRSTWNTRTTALIAAVRNGHIEIVRLLIEEGAVIGNNIHISPFTALLQAVEIGHLDIVRLLIEKGANVNQDGISTTALLIAAEKGYAEIACLLIENNANIDATVYMDGKGRHSALMLAAKNGYTDFVRLLIDHKADLLRQNNDGDTAFTLARKGKRAEIVEILEKALEERKRQKQLPAPEQNPKSNETWVKTGPETIAFVGIYPDIRRKLTETFNFSSRERIIISENLASGTEQTLPPESFDSINEAALRRAFDNFTRQSGIADEGFVLHGALRIVGRESLKSAPMEKKNVKIRQ